MKLLPRHCLTKSWPRPLGYMSKSDPAASVAPFQWNTGCHHQRAESIWRYAIKSTSGCLRSTAEDFTACGHFSSAFQEYRRNQIVPTIREHVVG